MTLHPSLRVLWLIPFFTVLLGLSAPSALADTVYLRNGSYIEGMVTEDDSGQIVVEVVGGTVTFTQKEVIRIERKYIKIERPPPESVQNMKVRFSSFLRKMKYHFRNTVSGIKQKFRDLSRSTKRPPSKKSPETKKKNPYESYSKSKTKTKSNKKEQKPVTGSHTY